MTDESFMAKAVKASTEAAETEDLGDKVISKSLEVGGETSVELAFRTCAILPS